MLLVFSLFTFPLIVLITARPKSMLCLLISMFCFISWFKTHLHNKIKNNNDRMLQSQLLKRKNEKYNCTLKYTSVSSTFSFASSSMPYYKKYISFHFVFFFFSAIIFYSQSIKNK